MALTVLFVARSLDSGRNPQPSTLNPQHPTLKPKTCTLHPGPAPCTLHPQTQTYKQENNHAGESGGAVRVAGASAFQAAEGVVIADNSAGLFGAAVISRPFTNSAQIRQSRPDYGFVLGHVLDKRVETLLGCFLLAWKGFRVPH